MTHGMMIAFARMGGIGARYLFFRSSQVPIAPIKVAAVPQITSTITPPVRMLASRQPIVSRITSYNVCYTKLLRYAYGDGWPIWLLMITVGVGEIISCGVLGLLLVFAVKKLPFSVREKMHLNN